MAKFTVHIGDLTVALEPGDIAVAAYPNTWSMEVDLRSSLIELAALMERFRCHGVLEGDRVVLRPVNDQVLRPSGAELANFLFDKPLARTARVTFRLTPR